MSRYIRAKHWKGAPVSLTSVDMSCAELQALLDALKASGLSGREIARRAEMKNSTVATYLSGERIPSLCDAVRLAEVVGKRLVWK